MAVNITECLDVYMTKSGSDRYSFWDERVRAVLGTDYTFRLLPGIDSRAPHTGTLDRLIHGIRSDPLSKRICLGRFLRQF